MTIRFAISSDIDHLLSGRTVRKGIDKFMAGTKKFLESDTARGGPVVKEDRDRLVRIVGMRVAIRHAGIYSVFVDCPPFVSRIFVALTLVRVPVTVAPIGIAPGADAFRLMRRENDVTQAFVDQCGHHPIIASSFGQPHAFGFTSESIAKVAEPPTNLRKQVALVAQRKNRVAVGLRDRVSVAIAPHAAFTIGIDDFPVSFQVLLFDPTQQRRAEVETYVCIVINDAFFICRGIDNARGGIRAVGFRMNALVPVMKGRRGRLFFDNSCPRIFARRLIKMAVNDERGHFEVPRFDAAFLLSRDEKSPSSRRIPNHAFLLPNMSNSTAATSTPPLTTYCTQVS